MEIVLLIAGLCLATVGFLVVLSEARIRRGAVEMPAQLIGFSTGDGASGTRFFHAVAQYAGLDGETRYLEASVGSSSPLGTVGDRVRVLLQPADPEQATIKSALPYVVGCVLAVMGLASCVAFFAFFRATPFSTVCALAVVGSVAWKVRGSLRQEPFTLQTWKDYKKKLLPIRMFTEATKGNIRWADRVSLEKALRNGRKANRVAIPLLVLAGVGLVVLGIHLRETTRVFLETAVRDTGTVVELVANRSSDSVTWAPLVEFEREGRKYRFKDSMSSSPPSYRRGDSVHILYDPFHPTHARIDRGWWNMGIPLLVGAFGALLCSLGVWMALRRPRAPLEPATVSVVDGGSP